MGVSTFCLFRQSAAFSKSLLLKLQKNDGCGRCLSLFGPKKKKNALIFFLPLPLLGRTPFGEWAPFHFSGGAPFCVVCAVWLELAALVSNASPGLFVLSRNSFKSLKYLHHFSLSFFLCFMVNQQLWMELIGAAALRILANKMRHSHSIRMSHPSRIDQQIVMAAPATALCSSRRF